MFRHTLTNDNARPERRGVSTRTVIEEAKARVGILEFAERICGPGVRRGREVAFRCPLHDDGDPSLRADPEKGLWYCDPCAEGGDVVRLAERAWGIPRPDVAAAEVLLAFGHELPQRPPSWFARQARQAPIRNRANRVRIGHVRELVYRLIWMPWLRRLPEEHLPDAEAEAWAEALWMAEHIYENPRGADEEEVA